MMSDPQDLASVTAELASANAEVRRLRAELELLRDDNGLKVISAVNTHPRIVDIEKQVKLFTEWAHRCVNQAHFEGREYVEAVCRMSKLDGES
jgi:pyruvate-formate lyase-activating enzyme